MIAHIIKNNDNPIYVYFGDLDQAIETMHKIRRLHMQQSVDCYQYHHKNHWSIISVPGEIHIENI